MRKDGRFPIACCTYIGLVCAHEISLNSWSTYMSVTYFMSMNINHSRSILLKVKHLGAKMSDLLNKSPIKSKGKFCGLKCKHVKP